MALKIEKYKGYTVIRNSLIPFKGYKGMNLYTLFFVRPKAKITDRFLNHEAIHSEQIKEVMFAFIPIGLLVGMVSKFWIGFLIWFLSYYLLYITEWIVQMIKHKFNTSKAYLNIPFEKEARSGERDKNYIQNRDNFEWMKYIFNT